MSEEEKKALEWIDKACTWSESTDSANRHRATLKAMLAQPRMPEDPSPEMLKAMWDAQGERMNPAIDRNEPIMLGAYLGLRAHLTKPPTKTVQVWRVEFANLTGQPQVNTKNCAVLANDEADRLRVLGCSCIRVTGPHDQEIPA